MWGVCFRFSSWRQRGACHRPVDRSRLQRWAASLPSGRPSSWGEPLTEAILPGTWLWVAGATNLYRLAGLVPVMGLVALAMAGTSGRSVRWSALLVALVGLEWTLGSPIAWRLPTTPDSAGPVEHWLRARPRTGADRPSRPGAAATTRASASSAAPRTSRRRRGLALLGLRRARRVALREPSRPVDEAQQRLRRHHRTIIKFSLFFCSILF